MKMRMGTLPASAAILRLNTTREPNSASVPGWPWLFFTGRGYKFMGKNLAIKHSFYFFGNFN
jgi:hypothetical protein